MRLAFLIGGCILIGILITLGVLAATGVLTSANRQAMIHEQGYAALPNGAQISYETTDLRLIDALHRWFAAQLADHGHDAMGQ